MRAMVFGVTGQDGYYLAKLLVEAGYEVIGLTRMKSNLASELLASRGLIRGLKFHTLQITDFVSVRNVIELYRPDEIYNVSGQTSVSHSFIDPNETISSIVTGTLNILEAIRTLKLNTKFYNAGSSECFGNTNLDGANENTPFSPRSPYGAAKSSIQLLVKNYRESYGIFCCTGICFNHESPIRSPTFVTQKIVRAAHQIYKNGGGELELGNVEIYRDWGYAGDYVEAMYRMLQIETPTDIIISTGKSVSLSFFATRVFEYFGLNISNYLRISPTLRRKTDILYSKGNCTRAKNVIGWTAQLDVCGVIDLMCSSQFSGDY